MSRKLSFLLQSNRSLGLEFSTHLGGELIVFPGQTIVFDLPLDTEDPEEYVRAYYSMYSSQGLFFDYVDTDKQVIPELLEQEVKVDNITSPLIDNIIVEQLSDNIIVESAKEVVEPTEEPKNKYKNLTMEEISSMNYRTVKAIASELNLTTKSNSREAYIELVKNYVKQGE